MLKVEAAGSQGMFHPVRLVIELNSKSDLRKFEAMVADVCAEGCIETDFDKQVDELFDCIQKAMEKMYEQYSHCESIINPSQAGTNEVRVQDGTL